MHTTHTGTFLTEWDMVRGVVTYKSVCLLFLVSEVVHFTLSGAIMGIQILRDSKLNLS